MKKKSALIGAGVLILLLLALVLWPQGLDLAKYQRAYQRGQYAQVLQDLAPLVARNPQWWEGRELLGKAALAQDRLDLALEQVMALQQGGQKTGSLQVAIEAWLRENPLLPDQGEAVIAAVGEALPLAGESTWLIKSYVQILANLGREEELPAALGAYFAQPRQIDTDLFTVLLDANALMVAACPLEQVWEINLLLEENCSPGYSWRMATLYRLTDHAQLQGLQEKYPGDMLLTAAWARILPPQEGLALLLAWEQEKSPPQADREFYSAVKQNLVGLAEHIAPEHLDWLDSQQLMALAAEAAPWPEKCRLLLARAEEEGADGEVLALIRGALGGPKPRLTILTRRLSSPLQEGQLLISPSINSVFLSPDGSRLVLRRGNTGTLYNLVGGEETALPDSVGHPIYQWAPDSSRFAEADWQGENSVRVYDIWGRARSMDLGSEDYIPVGWRDNNSLWLQPYRAFPSELAPPLLLDVETGEITGLETPNLVNVTLKPGPEGTLAWNYQVGGCGLLKGGQVLETPTPTREIVGWVPNGSAVILSSYGRGLELWDGGAPRSLGVKGSFLGWKNGREFYWIQPLEKGEIIPAVYFLPYFLLWSQGKQYSLHSYDLATGKTDDLDVLGYIVAGAGSTVLTIANDQVRVYELP